MNKWIILISGMSCSGKTSLIKELSKRGWSFFINEDNFPEECDFSGLKTRSDIIRVIGKGRSVFIALQKPLQRYLSLNDKVIVDSVKTSEDLVVIKELFPEVKMLCVYLSCPFEERVARYIKRNREKDHDISKNGLRMRDEEDIRWGTDYLRAHANIVLNTNQPLFAIADQFESGVCIHILEEI